MGDNDGVISVDRFIWVHGFATRLAALGAPQSMQVLMRLAETHYDEGERRDPVHAADLLWQHWPTENGALDGQE